MANLSMSNTRRRKRAPDFHTITGTGEIVRAGDCVLVKSSEPNKRPSIACVEKLETETENNFVVKVRWYLRPEETSFGRKRFHGVKELLLSDHYDTLSVNTIEGKCIVHSFHDYTKLEDIGDKDYYSRFEYKVATKELTSDRVPVYCKCEMPYNPDDLMMQCDGCKKWFHPDCVGMNIAQAQQLSNYLCGECSS